MKESPVLKEILDYCTEHEICATRMTLSHMVTRGGKTFFTPIRIHDRGCADILICRDGEAIAVETKSDTGKPSEWQKSWAKRWTDNRGRYLLIRSFDQFFQEF